MRLTMKKIINTEARTVTFTFDNDLPSVTCNADKLSRVNRDYAVLFGLGHRIGDNAAIPKSKENNFTVTEAMRRDAVVEMCEHLESGSEEWNLKASTRKAPLDPTILKIAERQGITYEQAQLMIAERFLNDMA
jgi:hypothetical protein